MLIILLSLRCLILKKLRSNYEKDEAAKMFFFLVFPVLQKKKCNIISSVNFRSFVDFSMK
jgi:hypothetical protein